MRPSRVIQSTFLAMIVVQSIGSIDGQHRLPAPRQFVAISVLWGILFLMADTAANRIAARLSVLVLLTGMIVGPFGKVVVGFLNTVATNFQPAEQIRNRFGSAQTPTQPATGATGAPEIA